MSDLIARIEGYASIYREIDLNGDRIAPGAFAAALKSPPGDIKMLYQHAAETPIGRWISFRDTPRGLYATGEIILGSDKAREVYALLKGGAIDGLSIGYRTVKARNAPGRDDRSDRNGLTGRKILSAELWEVSIVTFPMAKAARITHLGEPRSEGRPESGVHRHARAANDEAANDEAANDEAAFAGAVRGAAHILSKNQTNELSL